MISQQSRTAQLVALLLVVIFASPVDGFTPASIPTPRLSSSSSSSSSTALDATAVIAGATGYIGKSVVRESIRQGYDTIALVRDVDKAQNNPALREFLDGAQLVACDVTDAAALAQTLADITSDKSNKIDVMVSSRQSIGCEERCVFD